MNFCNLKRKANSTFVRSFLLAFLVNFYIFCKLHILLGEEIEFNCSCLN